MLPASHNRAYQDFLILLTKFSLLLENLNYSSGGIQLITDFKTLKSYFQNSIVDLNADDLPPSAISRWQSFQTELKREFRLLDTDILFFTAARQKHNRDQKAEAIKIHLTKLIAYSQLILNHEVDAET